MNSNCYDQIKNLKNYIVLISCVSKKLKQPAPAYQLYSPSTLFKAHWNFALKCLKVSPNFNNVFIISALHGLVEPTEKISPYNVTLKTMNQEEKDKWAQKVINQMQQKEIDLNTTFIFLAGKDCYEPLVKYLPNYLIIPNEPMPIGKRVQWFQKQIKNC